MAGIKFTLVPFKHRIELEPDISGLSFSHAMVQTAFFCEEKPEFSYIEKPQRIELPIELQRQIAAFFDATLSASIVQHGMVPVDVAKEKAENFVINEAVKKVEAMPLDKVDLPQPIAERVNQRVIEVLAQKAAQDPRISDAYFKSLEPKLEVDLKKNTAEILDSQPKSFLAKLKSALPWILF